MNAVTHLEKVIVGEVSAVTHLEKVIAGETSAVTYTEKVITGEATPITHLQKVIAGIESPVTHLEYVWTGGSPAPTEHEYTGVVPYSFNADGTPLLDWYIKGNTVQNGTPTSQNPIMPQGTGDLETIGTKAGQYKIPILSAGQTTPVYLGEVETTRRVKKLVLTGEENIMLNGKNDTREMLQAYFTLPSSGTTEATNIKCSHLDTLSSGASTFNAEGIAMRANGTDMIFGFAFANIDVTVADSTAVALTKLLAYLTAQYAAGTPVTVWYVLTTPETAVVNEPLMKIGDYADEVSNVATIPTNNGSTTIDVETAVKPSEVYIKYKGV